MTKDLELAVIGGTGIYTLPGLQVTSELDISTPFGPPSSAIRIGNLHGTRLAFLARHGTDHRLPPAQIPYRANIYALKTLDIRRIVGICACGSLREDLAPGSVAIPNQLVDLALSRQRTFFDGEFVAHVGLADPFCAALSTSLHLAACAVAPQSRQAGTLLTIDGPRFSTRAESSIYRQLGIDLIGMTTGTEASLAREAEMCYAVLAHITDYDAWRSDVEPVSTATVSTVLARNSDLASQILKALLTRLPPRSACRCSHALENALVSKQPPHPRENARIASLVRRFRRPAS